MFKKIFEAPRRISAPVRSKESKLLLCKCAKTKKPYFVRLDRRRGEEVWHFAYAFLYHDSLSGDTCIAAKREVINIGDDYEGWNGCPHCGNMCTTFCDCGTIFCSRRTGDTVTCPGCNQTYTTYAATIFDTQTSSH